jgi:DNA-binding protein H-NS
MKRRDLDLISTDELWALHERIAAALALRLTAERNALELRLKQLDRSNHDEQGEPASARRQYPKVFPKFRNPDRPFETWAGRGKQPRWLTAQLNSGKRIDDFRIDRTAA